MSSDPEGLENEPTVEELLAQAANKKDSEPVDASLKAIFHPFQQAALDEVEVDEAEAAAAMETDRKGLMKRLKDFVGGDLTRIAFPVFYNEPTSFLHRAAESAEFYKQLTSAASFVDDEAMRLVHIAVFAIAAYSSAERTTKPFNPLLGETFEWLSDETRFVAEQVSHHPPICASHMESKLFEWWQYKGVKANFTGNAVVSPPDGETAVRFKADNATYKWGGLTSCVHNLIVGRLWIDHYGKFVIESSKSKASATCEFTQCGWFSRGWHKVLATIRNAKGDVEYYVGGLWHKKLEFWSAKHGKNIDKVPDDAKTVLWEKPALPAKACWRGFTAFIDSICRLTPELKESLPRSDSRFRPDILELQKNNYRYAGNEKFKLEEQQRAERKLREAGTLGEWQQRWFEPTNDGGWKFNYKYWQAREARLQEKGIESFGPDIGVPSSASQ